MIPVTLEIEGLYSYKEKQTIDFTQLTSAGLFGIFGAVGSGKSSILEAILLALYGNTERLSSRGEKSSMVNLQSDRVAITFEFLAGKNNQSRYKAQYIATRNTRNWEDIRPASHTFYKATEKSWEPMDEGAEKILGMKMDHFRQTVIIPQGKFKDFIELKPKDRADMMKDLFGLERFELSGQTKGLLSVVYTQKLKLQTQLESLAEYSKELLQEHVDQLKELKEKESEAAQICTQKEVLYSQSQLVKQRFLELNELQIKWAQLQNEFPEVEKTKYNLHQYQKATQHFRPIFSQLDEIGVDLEKYKVSLTNCKRWKTDYEVKLSELIHIEAGLQKEFAKKGEREAKIRDLKKVIEINALEIESIHTKNKINKLTPSIKSCREKIDILTAQILEQEKELEAIITPDPNELADLKSTLREIGDIQKQMDQTEQERQQIKLQLSNTTEEIKGAYSKMPKSIKTTEEWILSEEHQLSLIQAQREKLLQKQGLSAYAQHLHDGEPCPLCGSIDHPNPLEAQFDTAELQSNENAIKEGKSALDTIRKLAGALDKILFTHRDLEEKLKDKEKHLGELENKKAEINEGLQKKGFHRPEDVEKALKEASDKTAKQQKLFQSLKGVRQECGQLTNSSRADEEALQKAQNEYTVQLSAIGSKKHDLQYKEFCDAYYSQTNEDIQKAIDKVQQAIDQLELKIQRNKDVLIESRGKQATNLANLKQYSELLEGCEARQSKLKDNLKSKMLEMGFELEDELKALLEQKLDVNQLESKIREFQRQWDITKEKREVLLENKAIRKFREDEFQQLREELEKVKQALEHIKGQVTITHNQMETTQKKLEEKVLINKSMESVEKRESNLKELDNLFKGSGFVKYVSSIYLKDLSHSANLRFMKLTKNNLSLEIDSDNTFWILDHLNGGKKRLMKTLSGGQTFQASLCLALSLAEKVKSLNRADQSFFFLDEGFGSLDRSSLRVVFETLKSLRLENRIVGIISHVEELQQEIGVYAKVELDPEKGSVVRYSY